MNLLGELGKVAATKSAKNALVKAARQLKAQQKFELKKADLAIKAIEPTAAAQADVADAESRSKLLAALPWVIGGVGVAAVLFLVMRKKGRS